MHTEENKGQETFTITGKWPDQSKSLKTQFTQLTDMDLKYEKGKESDLLSRLETKLSKTRDEVIKIINKI